MSLTSMLQAFFLLLCEYGTSMMRACHEQDASILRALYEPVTSIRHLRKEKETGPSYFWQRRLGLLPGTGEEIGQ